LLALVVLRVRVDAVAEVRGRGDGRERAGVVHAVHVHLADELARGVRARADALPVALPLRVRAAGVVAHVLAADAGPARSVRADVAVVAGERPRAGADSVAAGVLQRAGIAVVARAADRRVRAARRRIAGIGRADVVIVAVDFRMRAVSGGVARIGRAGI